MKLGHGVICRDDVWRFVEAEWISLLRQSYLLAIPRNLIKPKVSLSFWKVHMQGATSRKRAIGSSHRLGNCSFNDQQGIRKRRPAASQTVEITPLSNNVRFD